MSGSSIYFSKAGFNSQTFTSNGTFVVPSGVTNILAYVVGGGGGGGGGHTAGSNDSGGGGGSGGEITFGSLEVTPGGSVSVVIGPGGSDGSPGLDGGNGSDSYIRFDNRHVYAHGGLGGEGGNNGSQGGLKNSKAVYQSLGGSGAQAAAGGVPENGGFTQLGYFEGGDAGGGAFNVGGGGGGSAHGKGAEGGTSGGISDGFDAAANSGAGGGGGCSQGAGSEGGLGGSGIVILYWKKD